MLHPPDSVHFDYSARRKCSTLDTHVLCRRGHTGQEFLRPTAVMRPFYNIYASEDNTLPIYRLFREAVNCFLLGIHLKPDTPECSFARTPIWPLNRP